MGVLIVLPIAAALAVRFQRRFELMVFPAISLIAMVLGICGVVGSLPVGTYIGIVLAIPAIVILVNKRKLLGKYVLTPGFAAFCIYLVFFFLYARERYIMTDPAKMLYGPSLRNMFACDSLRDTNSFYHFTDPFPLGALWAYFCTRLIGGYSEWMSIYAFDVWLIAGILPFFYQIKRIKEENWQWLLMLAIGLFLPMLKTENVYRSFDMALLQTAAMVYTFYVVYRMIHWGERKGDVLFAACGFWAACTFTKYGMFSALPLMTGCCAIAFRDNSRRGRLFTALLSGCAVSFVLHLYTVLTHESAAHTLLFIPGSLLAAVLSGAVIAGVISRYNKGKQNSAIVIFLAMVVAAIAVTALVLHFSPYKEYVIEEAVEFTDKLFMGFEEENFVIGKHVIRIYDTTFLFLLLAVSGIAHGKTNKKNRKGVPMPDAFHAAFVFGVVLYLLVLCVLYIDVLRMPKANPIPKISAYVAPVVVLSAAALLFQAVRTWKKDTVLIAGFLFLLGCVYMDPVGEIFHKAERDYVFPVIKDCVESGKIVFTEEDRVFYMDPELFRDISVDFCWEVFPAGADTISGLHFNADPYRWSGGEIQKTMTPEELEALIRDGGYTYVYLDNIVDFHINKYHNLFALVGPGMTNDAIYRVEYDARGKLKLRFIAQE